MYVLVQRLLVPTYHQMMVVPPRVASWFVGAENRKLSDWPRTIDLSLLGSIDPKSEYHSRSDSVNGPRRHCPISHCIGPQIEFVLMMMTIRVESMCTIACILLWAWADTQTIFHVRALDLTWHDTIVMAHDWPPSPSTLKSAGTDESVFKPKSPIEYCQIIASIKRTKKRVREREREI